MQEFLVRRGYPYEDHEVFTPDGYILSLQRIPNPGAMPVLLVHGNFFDAWAWISGPNERSPGQQLYEAGFDVWLANNRGTPYGRRHVTLGEGREVDQNAKFWNWTYSTLARNDCPAIVAKVLHETGAERINYVGWSRGTNQAFIAMQDPALKAYFERHINIATMIAPVTYSKHTSSLSLQSLAAARAFDFLHRVWPYGFLSSDADYKPLNWLVQTVCLATGGAVCELVKEQMFGPSPYDDMEVISMGFFSNFPAGTAVKDVSSTSRCRAGSERLHRPLDSNCRCSTSCRASGAARRASRTSTTAAATTWLSMGRPRPRAST